MLKRKIMERLKEWKERSQGSTAILIDGARRVGKSFIAEEFAKANYESYILIDFNLVSDDIRGLFEHEISDLDNFFLLLQNYYQVELKPRNSIIIFDEVQQFPRARSMIKYLVADGRYDYIETGSLISIKKNVENIVIPSEEESIKLYPLDFEEFLWAIDEEQMANFIRDRFNELKPMTQALHRKAMTLFRQYLLVGGMPQAVARYVETKNFKEVDNVKRTILDLYRNDIVKHADKDADKILGVFDYIPAQLQSDRKRFQLSEIDSNARQRNFEEALFWLGESMTVNFCYNTTEPTVGLKSRSDRLDFKCYMGDTGLLISHTFSEKELSSEEIYKKILFDKLEFNNGFIVENIVAQMLRAAGHPLYYYNNVSKDSLDRMEIDFLLSKTKITTRHNISPIEVKSSKNYTLSSLKKFMKKYEQQLYSPMVLHAGDLEEKDGILYLPLYMTGLI